MAEFKVIKATSAPPPPRSPARLKARMADYEQYVEQVKVGQVGRLAPAAGESPRGVALRISRAGTRLGKPVQAWVADGGVYFRPAFRQ